MIVTLSLKPERVGSIKDEFPEAKIFEMGEDGFVKIQFMINTNYDALKLFHAGIHCGQDCKIKYNS